MKACHVFYLSEKKKVFNAKSKLRNEIGKVAYFQHDFYARQDPKLQNVLMEHGCAGIGLFWCLIEQLNEQGGVLSLDSIKGIAYSLHIEEDVVRSVITDFGLFKTDDKNFWSESANARKQRRDEVSDKRKKAANKRWGNDASSMQVHNIEDANAMQMQCTNDANAMQSYAIKNKIKNKKEYISSNEDNILKNNIYSTNVESSTSVDSSVEKSEEKPKKVIDYSRILNAWKKVCVMLPQPRSLSTDDQRKIRIRFHEMKTGEDDEAVYVRIEEIFKKIAASDFCKKGKWCTFRWVFANSNNWRKVEDGNYDNRDNDEENINDLWQQ